jgi:hypothetical protein
MTKINPADYQDLDKLNKSVIQTRYDAVVSLKNAYKNSATEIKNLRANLLEYKAEVDALTTTDTVDSTNRNKYNQEINRRLEALKTIEKFTAYPLPYGHEVRYFNGNNKEIQITLTLNYYPKGIYKGSINYHLCHLAAFDINNENIIRNIAINKLDPLNKTQYYSYDIALVNMITSSITNNNAVTSGTTSAFNVSSDPTGSYSVGDNLYLQDGTNLGTITSLSSNSITIGGGISQTLSASTTLYKEGITSTNQDTSKILEKNTDQLSIAFNIFNYNKTLVESAVSTIETIAKQLNIKLVLETD